MDTGVRRYDAKQVHLPVFTQPRRRESRMFVVLKLWIPDLHFVSSGMTLFLLKSVPFGAGYALYITLPRRFDLAIGIDMNQ